MLKNFKLMKSLLLPLSSFLIIIGFFGTSIKSNSQGSSSLAKESYEDSRALLKAQSGDFTASKIGKSEEITSPDKSLLTENKNTVSRLLDRNILDLTLYPDILEKILRKVSDYFEYRAHPHYGLEIRGNLMEMGNEKDFKEWLNIFNSFSTILRIVIFWTPFYLDRFDSFGILFANFNGDLTSISIQKCTFTEKVAENCRKFQFEKLKEFEMTGCDIDAESLAVIISTLPSSLEILNLNDLQWKGGKINFDIIDSERFRNLTVLNLESMQLQGSELIIKNLNLFQKLKMLSLADNCFDEDFFPEIKEMNFLEKLSIPLSLLQRSLSDEVPISAFPDSLRILKLNEDTTCHPWIDEFLKKFKNLFVDYPFQNDVLSLMRLDNDRFNRISSHTMQITPYLIHQDFPVPI